MQKEEEETWTQPQIDAYIIIIIIIITDLYIISNNNIIRISIDRNLEWSVGWAWDEGGAARG